MTPLRNTWLAALVLLSLATVAPAGVAAAGPRPVAAGDRVRIALRDSSSVVGRVLAAGSVGLDVAIEPDSARREIPREILAGLEVERRHNRAGRGAVIGVLVGSLAAIGLSSAIHGATRTEGATPGVVLLVGAGAGAALGAVLGEGSVRTRWEPATLP